MAFSTILIGLAVAYVVYYAVVIIYDLYYSDKGTQLVEEEEIEISEEENTISQSSYTPSVSVPSVSNSEQKVEEEREEEKAEGEHSSQDYSDAPSERRAVVAPAMNGGMDIKNLVKQASETPAAELDYTVQMFG